MSADKPTLYARELLELHMLERTALELRRVGMFVFLLTNIGSFVLTLASGGLLLPLMCVYALPSLLIVCIYHALASQVQRGRRWASGVGLAVAYGICAGMVALLWNTKFIFVLPIFEPLVLLAHLELIRRLLRSCTISRRPDVADAPPQLPPSEDRRV